MDIQNKVALVTGGASGLGAACVRLLTQSGAKAVITDLNAETGSALASELGSATAFVQTNVTDEASVQAAVDAAVKNFGGLHILINCAGIGIAERVLGKNGPSSLESFTRVIQVNLIGTASLVRAALPYLERAANPRIVNVASTLGLRVLGAATAYSASKFGVVGLTRGLALDLAGRVGVTLLIPGGMNTHFFDGRDPQFKPAADAFEKNQLNDPRNVAETVVFALSQPKGCEIRELIVTPSRETSWP